MFSTINYKHSSNTDTGLKSEGAEQDDNDEKLSRCLRWLKDNERSCDWPTKVVIKYAIYIIVRLRVILL